MLSETPFAWPQRGGFLVIRRCLTRISKVNCEGADNKTSRCLNRERPDPAEIEPVCHPEPWLPATLFVYIRCQDGLARSNGKTARQRVLADGKALDALRIATWHAGHVVQFGLVGIDHAERAAYIVPHLLHDRSYQDVQ